VARVVHHYCVVFVVVVVDCCCVCWFYVTFDFCHRYVDYLLRYVGAVGFGRLRSGFTLFGFCVVVTVDVTLLLICVTFGYVCYVYVGFTLRSRSSPLFLSLDVSLRCVTVLRIAVTVRLHHTVLRCYVVRWILRSPTIYPTFVTTDSPPRCTHVTVRWFVCVGVMDLWLLRC